MDHVVQKFRDFEAADRATRDYYRSLTPAQRIEILLEIIQQARESDGETEQRLAPVYRIVKLPRG